MGNVAEGEANCVMPRLAGFADKCDICMPGRGVMCCIWGME